MKTLDAAYMIRHSSRVILLMTALSVSLVFGCNQQQGQSKGEYSDSLIVHPRANDVRFSKHKGTDQLTYRVEEKFPASDVIGWISKKLRENGWEALAYHYLSPHLLSSHVKGWTKFIDATKSTKQIVHSWAAEWKDRSENVVHYALQYRYPEDGNPNLTELEVIAVYTPARLARQGQDAARKLQEEFSRQQKGN